MTYTRYILLTLLLPFFTHTSEYYLPDDTQYHPHHPIVRPIALRPAQFHMLIPVEDSVRLQIENTPLYFRLSQQWGEYNFHEMMTKYRQILIFSVLKPNGQPVYNYVGKFLPSYLAQEHTIRLHRIMYNDDFVKRPHQRYFAWNLSTILQHPQYPLIHTYLKAIAACPQHDLYHREQLAQTLALNTKNRPRLQ